MSTYPVVNINYNNRARSHELFRSPTELLQLGVLAFHPRMSRTFLPRPGGTWVHLTPRLCLFIHSSGASIQESPRRPSHASRGFSYFQVEGEVSTRFRFEAPWALTQRGIKRRGEKCGKRRKPGEKKEDDIDDFLPCFCRAERKGTKERARGGESVS